VISVLKIISLEGMDKKLEVSNGTAL